MPDQCTIMGFPSILDQSVSRGTPTYNTIKMAQEPTITAGEPTVRAMTEIGSWRMYTRCSL
jgi:hypothetical protein